MSNINNIPFNQQFTGLSTDKLANNLPLYFTSNESHQATSHSTLKSAKIVGDVYVGTGCLINLDFLATLNSRPNAQFKAVILDNSEKVIAFWTYALKAIKDLNDYETAKLALIGHLNKELATYYTGPANPKLISSAFSLDQQRKAYIASQVHEYKKVIASGLCFLSNQARYDALRKSVLRGDVVVIAADLTDVKQIKKIAAKIESLGCQIGCLYTSNIKEALSDITSYDKSIDLLRPQTGVEISAQKSWSLTTHTPPIVQTAQILPPSALPSFQSMLMIAVIAVIVVTIYSHFMGT